VATSVAGEAGEEHGLRETSAASGEGVPAAAYGNGAGASEGDVAGRGHDQIC